MLFFILGVVSIVFFDHDVKDSVSDHRILFLVTLSYLVWGLLFSLLNFPFVAEGVHKSLLIHRIYELVIHLGLSDHKVGF